MNSIHKFSQLQLPHVFDVSAAPPIPKEVFALGMTSTLHKDTVLVHYGEYPKHIFYLHKGTILGLRPEKDMKMNLAYVIREGFFGEGWYFSKHTSMDEMVTGEDSLVTRFSEESIKKLIAHPQVVNNFLFTLAVKSTSVETKYALFKAQSVKDRLKAFILNQFTLMGEKNIIELDLSQKELARIMNVHSVSISRAFSELKKEMDIQTAKNKIIISR